MPSDPITDYIRWMRTKGLSTQLVNRRASQLRAAEKILNTPLLRFRHEQVTALVERGRNRGLADSTLYTYSGHLRSFYSWAMITGRARSSPMMGAAIPKRPRYLPRPIAETDLELAMATADARTRVVLALASMAGLRAVEIARLDRDDVMDRHEPPTLLVHGKGDKPRLVPLSSALLLELQAYGLGRRGPVIRRLDGLHTQVSPSLISTLANRHLHAMGIPDTLHSLRHRAGTVLYRKTKDIRLVQDVLGHASPAQTAIYAMWSTEDAPRAMEQLALPVVTPVPAPLLDSEKPPHRSRGQRG